MLHFQTAMLIVWPVNLEIKTNAQNVTLDTVPMVTNVAMINVLTAISMRLQWKNAQYVLMEKLVTLVPKVL